MAEREVVKNGDDPQAFHAESKPSGILQKVRSFFEFDQRNTNFKKEFVGGIVTFLAMAYILVVNPGISSGLWSGNEGIPYGGVFFATAVGAGLATIVMAFLAKLPVALAPGMGVNAFFIGTIIGSKGYTWQEALALSFVGGLIFLAISFTKLRVTLVNAIPKELKAAIAVGIGFFIATVGLRLGGIFSFDGGFQLGDFSKPEVLLSLFSIVVIVVFHCIKGKISRFSFIISIVLTALVGVFFTFLGFEGLPAFGKFDYSPLADVKDVAFVGFASGFSTLFTGLTVKKAFTSLYIIFALLFVDIFDTAGTLVAVGKAAHLEDSEGNIPNMGKAMMTDAIGTVISSTLGTPEITSYVESATGVDAGARTGFASLVTGLLFLLSIGLFPIFNVFTYSSVTCGALVLVGVLMCEQINEIDFHDINQAIPAFLTIIGMVVTGSVADGIAFGFISYVIIKLIRGGAKEIHPIIYGSTGLFIVYFVLNAVV